MAKLKHVYLTPVCLLA